MIYKFFISIIFSQILYLGVFALSPGAIYVVNQSENLCGEFTRGNAEKTNWLQSGWKAVGQDEKLELDFSTATDCENSSTENCCKTLGFRYAGVPIGIETISDERKGAELLAAKGYIEAHSLDASKYLLENNITRKEVMKVILNASEIQLNQECLEIFTDVENDWGCKYIESALDNNYVTGNQKFRPNDLLTKTEALKLIFKARSIDKAYETLSWQQDYISTALYFGYIDKKFLDYNQIASRGWVFSVLGKTYPDFQNY